MGRARHPAEVVYLGVGGNLPWVLNHLVPSLQFNSILDLQGMGPAFAILPIGYIALAWPQPWLLPGHYSYILNTWIEECASSLLDTQGMSPAYDNLLIGYIFIQSTAPEQPLATALPRPRPPKHSTPPTGPSHMTILVYD